ncbi:MAG: hypothetical protein DFNUSKGM_000270 [Candidatus Fervidibacter sacchari]
MPFVVRHSLLAVRYSLLATRYSPLAATFGSAGASPSHILSRVPCPVSRFKSVSMVTKPAKAG